MRAATTHTGAGFLSLMLVVISCFVGREGAGSSAAPLRRGFYVHPQRNSFLTMAREEGTDKVQPKTMPTTSKNYHDYDYLYGKYLELHSQKQYVQKMLEIGLGCDMANGPLRSARLWRRYLPVAAEIWEAEFDAACVKERRKELSDLNVRVVVGDQANISTLHAWLAQSLGDFDLIIDDVGHSNMQMFNSFMVLFQYGLRPGGIYVIEDIMVSRYPHYIDGDKKHITIEIITQWLEAIAMDTDDPNLLDTLVQPKHKMPPGVRSIECARGMCVITKCYLDDKWCDNRAQDDTLFEAFGKPH